MIAPPLPADEAARLAALQTFDILDTAPEPAFDDLVRLAARICEVPVGLISLVDSDRQWFKARHGLQAAQTSRAISFCGHAILDPQRPLVVQDARRDERFADNPLVTGPTCLQFYAGVPLCVEPGIAVGTLCVIDHIPRELDDGQLEALQAIARQVTGQLALRRALRQQAASLEAQYRAAQALDHARDLADRASRLKSDFLANISHELRTPLQLILGFSELGQRPGRSAAETAAMFDDIRSAGSQMLELVNDLLQMSGLQAGSLELDWSELDLASAMTEVVTDLQPLAAAREVDVAWLGGTDALRLRSDRQRLQQVLRRVLINAIRFSRSGGVVDVTLQRTPESGALISVADRGPGIPPDELSSIFDVFEQSSATSTGAGGTGLGLSVGQGLMQALGGDIRAANRQGGGAVFAIEVPAAGPPAADRIGAAGEVASMKRQPG